MPIRRIPFGEWLPDLGEFNNEGLYKVKGAVNAGGRWLPAPIFDGVTMTGAASAEYAMANVGGVHVHSINTGENDIRVYVGVNDDILRSAANNSLTTERATASGLSSVTDRSSGWQFTSFGDAVYAAVFNPSTGSGHFLRAATPTSNFAPFVVSTAPTTYNPLPRFVSYIKGHLLIASVEMQNTLGEFTSNVFYPDLVMWSATDGLNDGPTRWGDELTANYPETVGSSYQFLKDDFGPITALCGGMDYAYIFKPRAIYRIDGPEWVISPVVTGAGTLYPNSVVRMYNDVYFWGPCGPARLRYGSSEIENLAVGKCQRAVTEFQNSAFLDYCFEIDDFTYPITGDELFGNTWGTDISAAADYRANLVAFFHGETVTTGSLDPDLARRSGCLVYDISTNRFSFFSVPSKVKYAKSVPRYGRNPLSPSAGNFSQHSVLDGVFCALNNDTMLVTTSIELANSIGDAAPPDEITISGAGDYLYDWFPQFTTPFNPLALDDQNGPITTAVRRVRVPFTLKRFDETVVDGYSSATYEWVVKVNVTVRTKNRYTGETEEVTGSWTSSDAYQASDGWIDLNSGKGSTEGEYHQFEIQIITLNSDGTKVNSVIVHLRDLTYFEVEYDMGSPCGSTYMA